MQNKDSSRFMANILNISSRYFHYLDYNISLFLYQFLQYECICTFINFIVHLFPIRNSKNYYKIFSTCGSISSSLLRVVNLDILNRLLNFCCLYLHLKNFGIKVQLYFSQVDNKLNNSRIYNYALCSENGNFIIASLPVCPPSWWNSVKVIISFND